MRTPALGLIGTAAEPTFHINLLAFREVQVSVTGSPAKCVEGLMQVIKAGAGMLMFNPAFDYQEQVGILAQEVIPHLKL